MPARLLKKSDSTVYKVQYRLAGHALWNLSAAPMTIQAAYGHARAVEGLRIANDVRIVPGEGLQPAVATLVDLMV